MTDHQHPITPTPELVQHWTDEIYGGPGVVAASDDICLAKLAAQWGADQELEATLAEVSFLNSRALADRVRTARRPKPMTNTTRDLIQRMATELDLYRQMARDDCTSTHPFSDEARAYLAQTEMRGIDPTNQEDDRD